MRSPVGTGIHPTRLKQRVERKGMVWDEGRGVWMFPDEARQAGVKPPARKEKHPYLRKGD